MKKVSALVIALIFLLCMPAYADEINNADSINAYKTATAVEEETSTEVITTASTSSTLVGEKSGDCRVALDYEIAMPVDAQAKGLDPIYRVASSYVDDNGETWYVMAGRKGVVLKETDCSVQKYIDVDTDDLGRQQVVRTALERLGCPYAYGKSGPEYFDCSGFVQYCMKSVGVTVPRSSYAICTMDMKIDKSNIKAGDILATPGHVGIYIGNGCFIHAQDHKSGVVTDYLDVYNAKSYKKFRYYINILD